MLAPLIAIAQTRPFIPSDPNLASQFSLPRTSVGAGVIVLTLVGVRVGVLVTVLVGAQEGLHGVKVGVGIGGLVGTGLGTLKCFAPLRTELPFSSRGGRESPALCCSSCACSSSARTNRGCWTPPITICQAVASRLPLKPLSRFSVPSLFSKLSRGVVGRPNPCPCPTLDASVPWSLAEAALSRSPPARYVMSNKTNKPITGTIILCERELVGFIIFVVFICSSPDRVRVADSCGSLFGYED